MPTGETAEIDFPSGEPEQPCLSVQPKDPGLSSINIAANLAATSGAVISVGLRINSRQATASRVSFDDPLIDNIEISQSEALSESCIDRFPSDLRSQSDSAPRAPENP